jgi:hypothetical protein
MADIAILAFFVSKMRAKRCEMRNEMNKSGVRSQKSLFVYSYSTNCLMSFLIAKELAHTRGEKIIATVRPLQPSKNKKGTIARALIVHYTLYIVNYFISIIFFVWTKLCPEPDEGSPAINL